MISIIVPTSNCEKYIRRCLESILKQSYTELEAIVVVNNCTDNTYEIAKEIASTDDRVIVEYTDRGGVSYARNRGLDIAKGDIIGFCDSDDYLSEGILQVVNDELVEKKFDMLTFGFNYVDENGELIFASSNIEEDQYKGREFIKCVLLDNGVLGTVWNKYMSRNILDGIRFDESLTHCEDTHFLVNILQCNPSSIIGATNIKGYNYRENIASATKSMEKLFDGAENRYIKAMDKILFDFDLSKESKICVNVKKVYFAYSYIWNYQKKESLNSIEKERINKGYTVIKNNMKDAFLSQALSIKEKLIIFIILVFPKRLGISTR